MDFKQILSLKALIWAAFSLAVFLVLTEISSPGKLDISYICVSVVMFLFVGFPLYGFLTNKMKRGK